MGPEGRLGGPVRVGLLALGDGGGGAAAFDSFALSCGPEVRLVSSPERGVATLEVGFSAYVRDDRDGEHDLHLAWDFGNGTTGEGGHGRFLKYLAPGSYRPTLRATDADGNITTVSTHVTVLAHDPPCPAASDAFAGNALDTRWRVLRPVAAGLDVADGRLRLRPYAGLRNVVAQPAPAGPWTMTTAVDAGGGAGLALWREDRPADVATVPSAGGAGHLRIVSDGARPATFTALRSEDGTDWSAAGAPFRVGGTGPLHAGVVALGTSGSAAVGFDGIDVTGPVPCGAPDAVAPETSHVLEAHGDRATVRLAAVDDATGSGVARTEHRVDGGPVAAYAGPFAVAGAGPHRRRVRSADRAGNAEPFRRIELALGRHARARRRAAAVRAASCAAGRRSAAPRGRSAAGAPARPAPPPHPAAHLRPPRAAGARGLHRGHRRPARAARARADDRAPDGGVRRPPRAPAATAQGRGPRAPPRRRAGAGDAPGPRAGRPGGPRPGGAAMIARLGAFSTSVRGRRIVIAAWVLLALALAPLQPRLQDAASNENEAFLADSAESTEVNDLIDERFELGREVTALVVYSRPGAQLTQDDYNRIDTEMRALCEERAISDLKSVVTPTGVACGTWTTAWRPRRRLRKSRGTARRRSPPWRPPTRTPRWSWRTSRRCASGCPGRTRTGCARTSRARPASPPTRARPTRASTGPCCAITLVLVLVLLLATYRSPLVAVVPLVTVALAYLIAAGVVYGLFKAGLFGVTGQSTAILIVLMFGAGTDYCLLLVSRYREELRAGGRREAAMARATAHSGRAIVSAGATVIVAMLVLTLADFRATRDMGPALAAGIAVMVAAGLTLLPALLSTLGPRAFHPTGDGPLGDRAAGTASPALLRARPGAVTAVASRSWPSARSAPSTGAGRSTSPRASAPAEPSGHRRGPRPVRAGAGGAGGAGGRHDALPAVSRRSTRPTTCARDDGELLQRRAAHARRPRAGARPVLHAGADPIPRLRDTARAAAGGARRCSAGSPPRRSTRRGAARRRGADRAADPGARPADRDRAGARRRRAALPRRDGGALLRLRARGERRWSSPVGRDSDPGLPLFAFIFLVALGVDYNIFLIGRIREERPARAPRPPSWRACGGPAGSSRAPG